MNFQANDTIYSKRFGNVQVTRVEGGKVYFMTTGGEKHIPAALAKPAKKNGAPKKSKAQKDAEAIARDNARPVEFRVHRELMKVQNKANVQNIDIEIWGTLVEEIESKITDATAKDILSKVNALTITDKQAWLIGYKVKEANIQIENA